MFVLHQPFRKKISNVIAYCSRSRWAVIEQLLIWWYWEKQPRREKENALIFLFFFLCLYLLCDTFNMLRWRERLCWVKLAMLNWGSTSLKQRLPWSWSWCHLVGVCGGLDLDVSQTSTGRVLWCFSCPVLLDLQAGPIKVSLLISVFA